MIYSQCIWYITIIAGFAFSYCRIPPVPPPPFCPCCWPGCSGPPPDLWRSLQSLCRWSRPWAQWRPRWWRAPAWRWSQCPCSVLTRFSCWLVNAFYRLVVFSEISFQLVWQSVLYELSLKKCLNIKYDAMPWRHPITAGTHCHRSVYNINPCVCTVIDIEFYDV